MRKAPRLFFVLSLLLLMASSASAQVPLPSKGSYQSQNAQSQRQVDEQLARGFYNNKEYDKGRANVKRCSGDTVCSIEKIINNRKK